MKTAVVTSSSSSAKSSTSMEDDRSEIRDSSYFLGCRRDANCACDICLASINATLDLMPRSNQRSSISCSKPIMERSPIPFNPAILSPPRRITRRRIWATSPLLKSTAKSNPLKKPKTKKKNKSCSFEFEFWRFFVGMSLIFAVDFGSSWVVSRFLRPKLSAEIVGEIGKQSWVVQDLNGRLGFLQIRLNEIINGKVENCSSIDSVWKLNQDGLFLRSRCTLYKSAAEEVSIWGWPLQSAGLLTSGFSSRSFTILSGRVTEWSEGKIGSLIRKANSSWERGRWSSSAIQLDLNTWVLEYRTSSILENSRLIRGALELLRFRVSRTVGEMKQQFWLLPGFANKYRDNTAQDSFRFPT